MEINLSHIFQRVTLNRETSSWRPILDSVPQGSISVPLLFFIYINHMPDGLKSNVKSLVDSASILSIVKYKNKSVKDVTHDLSLI